MGHGISFEDGTETDNAVRDNVVMNTIPAYGI